MLSKKLIKLSFLLIFIIYIFIKPVNGEGFYGRKFVLDAQRDWDGQTIRGTKHDGSSEESVQTGSSGWGIQVDAYGNVYTVGKSSGSGVNEIWESIGSSSGMSSIEGLGSSKTMKILRNGAEIKNSIEIGRLLGDLETDFYVRPDRASFAVNAAGDIFYQNGKENIAVLKVDRTKRDPSESDYTAPIPLGTLPPLEDGKVNRGTHLQASNDFDVFYYSSGWNFGNPIGAPANQMPSRYLAKYYNNGYLWAPPEASDQGAYFITGSPTEIYKKASDGVYYVGGGDITSPTPYESADNREAVYNLISQSGWNYIDIGNALYSEYDYYKFNSGDTGTATYYVPSWYDYYQGNGYRYQDFEYFKENEALLSHLATSQFYLPKGFQFVRDLWETKPLDPSITEFPGMQASPSPYERHTRHSIMKVYKLNDDIDGPRFQFVVGEQSYVLDDCHREDTTASGFIGWDGRDAAWRANEIIAFDSSVIPNAVGIATDGADLSASWGASHWGPTVLWEKNYNWSHGIALLESDFSCSGPARTDYGAAPWLYMRVGPVVYKWPTDQDWSCDLNPSYNDRNGYMFEPAWSGNDNSDGSDAIAADLSSADEWSPNFSLGRLPHFNPMADNTRDSGIVADYTSRPGTVAFINAGAPYPEKGGIDAHIEGPSVVYIEDAKGSWEVVLNSLNADTKRGSNIVDGVENCTYNRLVVDKGHYPLVRWKWYNPTTQQSYDSKDPSGSTGVKPYQTVFGDPYAPYLYPGGISAMPRKFKPVLTKDYTIFYSFRPNVTGNENPDDSDIVPMSEMGLVDAYKTNFEAELNNKSGGWEKQGSDGWPWFNCSHYFLEEGTYPFAAQVVYWKKSFADFPPFPWRWQPDGPYIAAFGGFYYDDVRREAGNEGELGHQSNQTGKLVYGTEVKISGDTPIAWQEGESEAPNGNCEPRQYASDAYDFNLYKNAWLYYKVQVASKPPANIDDFMYVTIYKAIPGKFSKAVRGTLKNLNHYGSQPDLNTAWYIDPANSNSYYNKNLLYKDPSNDDFAYLKMGQPTVLAEILNASPEATVASLNPRDSETYQIEQDSLKASEYTIDTTRILPGVKDKVLLIGQPDVVEEAALDSTVETPAESEVNEAINRSRWVARGWVRFVSNVLEGTKGGDAKSGSTHNIDEGGRVTIGGSNSPIDKFDGIAVADPFLSSKYRKKIDTNDEDLDYKMMYQPHNTDTVRTFGNYLLRITPHEKLVPFGRYGENIAFLENLKGWETGAGMRWNGSGATTEFSCSGHQVADPADSEYDKDGPPIRGIDYTAINEKLTQAYTVNDSGIATPKDPKELEPAFVNELETMLASSDYDWAQINYRVVWTADVNDIVYTDENWDGICDKDGKTKIVIRQGTLADDDVRIYELKGAEPYDPTKQNPTGDPDYTANPMSHKYTRHFGFDIPFEHSFDTPLDAGKTDGSDLYKISIEIWAPYEKWVSDETRVKEVDGNTYTLNYKRVRTVNPDPANKENALNPLICAHAQAERYVRVLDITPPTIVPKQMKAIDENGDDVVWEGSMGDVWGFTGECAKEVKNGETEDELVIYVVDNNPNGGPTNSPNSYFVRRCFNNISSPNYMSRLRMYYEIGPNEFKGVLHNSSLLKEIYKRRNKPCSQNGNSEPGIEYGGKPGPNQPLRLTASNTYYGTSGWFGPLMSDAANPEINLDEDSDIEFGVPGVKELPEDVKNLRFFPDQPAWGQSYTRYTINLSKIILPLYFARTSSDWYKWRHTGYIETDQGKYLDQSKEEPFEDIAQGHKGLWYYVQARDLSGNEMNHYYDITARDVKFRDDALIGSTALQYGKVHGEITVVDNDRPNIYLRIRDRKEKISPAGFSLSNPSVNSHAIFAPWTKYLTRTGTIQSVAKKYYDSRNGARPYTAPSLPTGWLSSYWPSLLTDFTAVYHEGSPDKPQYQMEYCLINPEQALGERNGEVLNNDGRSYFNAFPLNNGTNANPYPTSPADKQGFYPWNPGVHPGAGGGPIVVREDVRADYDIVAIDNIDGKTGIMRMSMNLTNCVDSENAEYEYGSISGNNYSFSLTDDKALDGRAKLSPSNALQQLFVDRCEFLPSARISGKGGITQYELTVEVVDRAGLPHELVNGQGDTKDWVPSDNNIDVGGEPLSESESGTPVLKDDVYLANKRVYKLKIELPGKKLTPWVIQESRRSENK